MRIEYNDGRIECHNREILTGREKERKQRRRKKNQMLNSNIAKSTLKIKIWKSNTIAEK